MSKLNSATMNPDSEVTADLLTKGDVNYRSKHHDVLKDDKLYTTTTDILIDATPVAPLKDLYEVIKGEKFLSGKKLSDIERLSLISSISKTLLHLNDIGETLKDSKLSETKIEKNYNESVLKNNDDNLEKINLKYSTSITKKAVDTYHKTPIQFDEYLIKNGTSLIRSDGRIEYMMKGYINGKEGIYHTTVKDTTTVIHKNFVPIDRWDKSYRLEKICHHIILLNKRS